MNTNNPTRSSTGEISGSKFFTWASIVVAAALLVAVTTELTANQGTPAPAQTVRSGSSNPAS